SVPIETPTTTGRVGLAGWSTPNPPLVGSDGGFREVNGWLGFGLAVRWGGPPPDKAPTRRAEPKTAAPSEPARGAAHPHFAPPVRPPTIPALDRMSLRDV